MKREQIFTVIFLFSLACVSCSGPNPSPSDFQASIPDKIDFNFHVRPILSDRCFACHGPDENARKADLRLDTKEGAFALLDSAENRFAILPNNLNKSHLYHRIISTDPEVVMPPPESNLTLSEREVAILKKWIEQGAEWKDHWAFIPPSQPETPYFKNNNWIQNPIDHFILQKLQQEGLQPAKKASKEKLIRRLSFDLRGLPPSIEEIDAFLDDDSPKAYEKLIDQFLAQPAFGERMALEWMDIARYADSHGYQDDIERSMWPWRDWVIEAFNKNMPYDQFVSWQLAGDLFPDPSYEQKLATGFNRNHKITQEVGVIDEEYRVTYVLDRVNTFSTAFLGLTVECAQCHDHKYDPISQKEYYSLFSFFNNIPEKGRVDYNVEVAEPSLPLPQEKIDELKQYITVLLDNQKLEHQNYIADEWAKGFTPNQIKKEENILNTQMPPGLISYYPMDYIENDLMYDLVKNSPSGVVEDLIPIPGKFSGGFEFMGKNFAKLDPKNTLDVNRSFSVSFWIKSLDGGIRGVVLAGKSRKNSSPGLIIRVTNNKNLMVSIANRSNETLLSFLTKEEIPENRWTQVTFTYNGNRKIAGTEIYMDGKPLKKYILKDNLRGQATTVLGYYLGVQSAEGNLGLTAGQLDELLIFNRALSQQEVKSMISINPIQKLITKKEKNKTDQKRLFYHQLLHEDAQFLAITERLREYKIREGRMTDIVLKPTMVMKERDTLRPTFVLNRGQYDAPTEEVDNGTPKAVLPFDKNLPKNRLGLAKWTFNPKNPLTARVAVNRYWQLIFGKGIVPTPGDFGSQGTLPSHPELLDWLAVTFKDSGWNVKKLIKRMVASSTYQQSVEIDPMTRQLDPENTFYARGPQARLSAEMIRDHALAISGLMSDEVGGPSVRPYQPKGLWLEVASGNQSLRKYIQGHGKELYRRSLYTFWKRTSPPPSMTIFDAQGREQCIMQRRPTSTPMQALVLLNDPQFTESSKLIAARMLNEGGISTKNKIQFAFKLATSRAPNQKELALLTNLYQQEKKDFINNPQNAESLINIGEYQLPNNLETAELAAYTIVANAILNLTETILKG